MGDHSIVVGGSKGLGRTVARALRDGGHRVTVLSRTPPADLDGVMHVPVDLVDDRSVGRAIEWVKSDAQDFRNLLFFQRARTNDSSNPWDDEMSVSVRATNRIIEGLTGATRAGNEASIVVVSSLASDRVVSDQPPEYHAAKAALNALVRFHAVALGPKGYRVNGVTPGPVIKEEAAQYYSDHPEVPNAVGSRTPLGRMAHVKEVVPVIEFLCSEAASFMTGQVLVADGGLSLRLVTQPG